MLGHERESAPRSRLSVDRSARSRSRAPPRSREQHQPRNDPRVGICGRGSRRRAAEESTWRLRTFTLGLGRGLARCLGRRAARDGRRALLGEAAASLRELPGDAPTRTAEAVVAPVAIGTRRAALGWRRGDVGASRAAGRDHTPSNETRRQRRSHRPPHMDGLRVGSGTHVRSRTQAVGSIRGGRGPGVGPPRIRARPSARDQRSSS